MDAPFADVAFTVPIDARVRDVEPPQEVLLFVTYGRLNTLELVDYGRGPDPDELPPPERLESPTVYTQGREPTEGQHRHRL